MKILGYMASECENDDIVIEESLRESFFDYIDKICGNVLKNILDTWAEKVS